MRSKGKQAKPTSDSSELVAAQKNKSVTQESFMAHAMQIMGDNGGYKPTERQVDKILELQEKGMEYTHKERTNVLPKQWLELVVFVVIIASFFGVLVFVAIYAPNYLGETITGILGFLSGGVGGYGIAKAKTTKKEED